MPINFPSNPLTNQYFTSGGTTWIYDGSKWNFYVGPYSIYQASSPTGTIAGQLWVDNDDNRIYVYDGTNWDAVYVGGPTGGGSDKIFYENDQTVTTNYTITQGNNAISCGPVIIDTSIVVTISSGSVWSII